MTIDIFDDLPTIGGKALGRVVRHPSFDIAVDRNAIVVVDANQFAKTQGASERSRLVRDALHHATVTEEDPGVVIDDVMAFAIKLRRQQLFGQCHTNGSGNALTERTGGGLDTDRRIVLGMTRSART